MCDDGVVGFYSYSDLETAKCLVLISDVSRSLLTKIGCANNLPCSILQKEGCKKALKQARIFYISGFALSLPEITVNTFIDAAIGKTLVVNLGAPFVCEKFSKSLDDLISKADFIIGNECEFKALARMKNINMEDSNESLIQNLAFVICKNKNTILIMTRGAENILVSCSPKVNINVPFVPSAEIKDTNGAGDAFVGGFISGLIHSNFKQEEDHKKIHECIEYGVKISQVVLRQTGCQLPSNINL